MKRANDLEEEKILLEELKMKADEMRMKLELAKAVGDVDFLRELMQSMTK
jgi:hypothetical protein